MAEISNKTLTTTNIQQALETFAQENFITLDECAFNLHKVETRVKTNLNPEYQIYGKKELQECTNRERIINEHIRFKQYYTITLKKVESCTLKLDYSIEESEYFTHPELLLSPKSIIPYKQYTPKEMLNLLYMELNKIKISKGIMIYLFDKEMIKTLKILVKYIYAGKFKKRVRLPLFDGIEPVITRPSRLILWFEEKNHDNQVNEVEENELLIEYKKSIYGKTGLNAKGKIIDAEYADNIEELDIEVDEGSISVKEDKNSKRYISKCKGYAHYNGQQLSVNHKVNLHKISRVHKSIAAQEENNIEVTISQNDTNRDSVGEGVSITSESIHVDGFVGANSVLESITLEIEGATHQDSKQFSKLAKINRHKGTLRCHDAKITLLEGGEVHATTADIETCLGGSIYAKDVTIGHVKNNLKVFASNSITINLVSGEDNRFTINSQEIPILNSKINFIEKDISDLKYKLEQAQRHNPSQVEIIKKEISLLRDEIQKIHHAYKDAKITIHKPFRGLNYITFTIDKENEIVYKTQEQQYQPFYLQVNENVITLLPVKKSLHLES